MTKIIPPQRKRKPKMATVELFYRDGANYKFNLSFEVDWYNAKRFSVGQEINYTSLGIQQEEFHKKIGYSYNSETDHTIVEILSIK